MPRAGARVEPCSALPDARLEIPCRQQVIITGAAGGVGWFAAQLAARGEPARSITCSSTSPETATPVIVSACPSTPFPISSCNAESGGQGRRQSVDPVYR